MKKKRICSHAICASTAKQHSIKRSDGEERERGRVFEVLGCSFSHSSLHVYLTSSSVHRWITDTVSFCFCIALQARGQNMPLLFVVVESIYFCPLSLD